MSELRTSVIAWLLATTLATCSGYASAEQPRDASDTSMALDETVISGNQELDRKSVV